MAAGLDLSFLCIPLDFLWKPVCLVPISNHRNLCSAVDTLMSILNNTAIDFQIRVSIHWPVFVLSHQTVVSLFLPRVWELIPAQIMWGSVSAMPSLAFLCIGSEWKSSLTGRQPAQKLKRLFIGRFSEMFSFITTLCILFGVTRKGFSAPVMESQSHQYRVFQHPSFVPKLNQRFYLHPQLFRHWIVKVQELKRKARLMLPSQGVAAHSSCFLLLLFFLFFSPAAASSRHSCAYM